MANFIEKVIISSTIILNDGISIPRFGLGVYQSTPGNETYNACLKALNTGYLQIDTAAIYTNEQDVGRAVRDSKIPQQNLFITTKLWSDSHGISGPEDAIVASLSKMGLSYVDLYLMHSPRGGKVLETWGAMIELKKKGLAKSIGVSNFGIQHLEKLLEAYPNNPPSLNQLEISPYLTRNELVKYCMNNSINIQAYSPLTKGQKLSDPRLIDIAKRYNKSTAQILLRWSIQRNFIVIPKTVKEDRLKSNADIFDFDISEADMNLLSSFDEYLVTDWDPTVDQWES